MNKKLLIALSILLSLEATTHAAFGLLTARKRKQERCKALCRVEQQIHESPWITKDLEKVLDKYVSPMICYGALTVVGYCIGKRSNKLDNASF